MFGLPVAPLASGATATTVAASSSVREAPIVGHKGSIYKLQGLTAAPLSFSARAAGRHLCKLCDGTARGEVVCGVVFRQVARCGPIMLVMGNETATRLLDAVTARTLYSGVNHICWRQQGVEGCNLLIWVPVRVLFRPRLRLIPVARRACAKVKPQMG